jgi:hypothetical protein
MTNTYVIERKCAYTTVHNTLHHENTKNGRRLNRGIRKHVGEEGRVKPARSSAYPAHDGGVHLVFALEGVAGVVFDLEGKDRQAAFFAEVFL